MQAKKTPSPAEPGGEGKSTRRRGPRLEAAVLDAAWQELQSVGYASLTMEGVAERAHTGKAVLYRRWPTRAALAFAAIRRHLPRLASNVPDTGTLREDVLEVLRHLRRAFQTVGPRILNGLMSEFDDMPADAFDVAPDVVEQLLARAARRGEIASADVPRRVAALPSDLLRHELLLRHREAPDAFLAEIVDEVFLPLVRRRPAGLPAEGRGGPPIAQGGGARPEETPP
jgi:AcrR family transcriptional regulator